MINANGGREGEGGEKGEEGQDHWYWEMGCDTSGGTACKVK